MTGSPQALKEKLENLRSGPDTGTADIDLVPEMLAHIGSTDPVLRDDLIYETFACWIEGDRLSPAELKQILNTCLDESHLFFRIGAREGDSVFTRTFSLLVIALVVDAHRRRKFLTAADLRDVKAKMIQYMAVEKDVRGYVGDKGWAHSTAHASDVFGQLARCDELTDRQDMLDILNSLREKVVLNSYVYLHKEDERMARAVVSVLGRKTLDDQTLEGWLESFAEIRKIGSHPEDDYLRANVKMFLRSLYFQLLPDCTGAQTRASIEAVLLKLNQF